MTPHRQPCRLAAVVSGVDHLPRTECTKPAHRVRSHHPRDTRCSGGFMISWLSSHDQLALVGIRSAKVIAKAVTLPRQAVTQRVPPLTPFFGPFRISQGVQRPALQPLDLVLA